MRTFTRNLGRNYYVFRSKVGKSIVLFARFHVHHEGKKGITKIRNLEVCYRLYQCIRSDL